VDRVRRLRFGLLVLVEGVWPEPADSDPGPLSPCDVLTLSLDHAQNTVVVKITAGESFVTALRAGKAVAWGGPSSGSTSYELIAPGIDSVVVYVKKFGSLMFCIADPHNVETEERDWGKVPYIVENLQLPLRELQSTLTTRAREYAQASTRLSAGESLDHAEFTQLANILRAGVSGAGPPRPIDQVLLLRPSPSDDFEEMVALDPLRALLSQPRWRRVLGFGYFDNDPALKPGQSYEYRISAWFPDEDLQDRVYGFHTTPSGTLLPTDLFLDDLHVRLPQPTAVTLGPKVPATGTIAISRRGIALANLGQNFWLMPDLEGFSIVLDFPSPVTSVELELEPGHSLSYSYLTPPTWPLFLPPAPSPNAAVPAGPRARLAFSAPVDQLRLRGLGFLYGIRILSGATGKRKVSVVLPPLTLVNTSRPTPPAKASITNLQQPAKLGKLSLTPKTAQPISGPSRHELGFEVRWRPASGRLTKLWPATGTAAPPLEATVYALEHRQAADAAGVSTAAWGAVLEDENWMLGDRDDRMNNTGVRIGENLMALFPEIRTRPGGAAFDLIWRDVFDFAFAPRPAWRPVRRPVPLPGTYHQYRVFAIDAIGRPSLTATETNVLRLEKHVPPPVPVGPAPSPVTGLPRPTGVEARTLVRGEKGLSAADQVLLGGSQNAIVLRWGWHEPQRGADPFTSEFRIYFVGPLDAVGGTITNVVRTGGTLFGEFQVALTLDRVVAADAAKGLYLEAGYPFFVRTHTGGTAITATVESHLAGPFGAYAVPTKGRVALPLPLSHDMTRPTAWTERVEVQSLTGAESYQAVLRNRLILDPSHPRDAAWVGVSAADSQSYITDSLAPTQNRPGNESAIVPIRCEARYHGRPVFGFPPSLAPVPVVTSPEPTGRPISFTLDLTPYLQGLGAGDAIFPERLGADSLFSAYYATADGRVMARAINPFPGDFDQEVGVANPGDRSSVIAALRSARTETLEDRFVVYLAGMHPYRDRLFAPAQSSPVPFGPFAETLPPKTGRFVYRIRLADAIGHLSTGDAIAGVIVRVPSLVPAGAPERVALPAGSAPASLGLRLANDSESPFILVFSQSPVIRESAVEETDVMRVPNRPDLYRNGHGVLLRAPNGSLLNPLVKSLNDPDVLLDPEGFQNVVLTFPVAAGERVRVWACTMTRDGVPSLLGGPWSVAMPLPPLPIPVLNIMAVGIGLQFTWSALPYDAAIERSADGARWERVSPVLPYTRTDFTAGPASGNWKYRLKISSIDGRSQYSNVVTH
jgi:hypothetical protein